MGTEVWFFVARMMYESDYEVRYAWQVGLAQVEAAIMERQVQYESKRVCICVTSHVEVILHH